MRSFDYQKEKQLFLNSFNNKRYVLYYYMSFSIVLIIIFIAFIIYPITTDMIKENNQITAVKAMNVQMQNRINLINSTYLVYSNKVAKNTTAVNNSLPKNQNTAFIFGNVYQIFQNNALQLDSIAFSNNINSQLEVAITPFFASAFPIDITGAGTYQNLLSALATLSAYPQRIVVYNVSFAASNNNLSNNFIGSSGLFQLSAIVFYSKL
jgi:hypothetical protein